MEKIKIKVNIKNTNLTILVLTLLVFSSLAWHSYAEEKSTTTKNIFLDSDQDGLADDEEKTYGTDPRKADTDGDNYSDGAEIKSGYNPLKPSPGDKFIPEENPIKTAPADPDQKNLTREVSQKISTALNSENNPSKEINIDAIKTIVAESLQTETTMEELPPIDPKEIKIKKQNYSKLSPEKQLEKKKDDLNEYISGISYVLISNSPEPITSNDDLDKIDSLITNKLTTALTTQSTSSIEDLAVIGEKTLAQIKDVEVPEEIAEDHIKGLQFARYASQLKDKINPAQEDPLSDIANYSKMQGLILNIADFYSTIETKASEYELDTNTTLQDKLEKKGVALPADFLEEINK